MQTGPGRDLRVAVALPEHFQHEPAAFRLAVQQALPALVGHGDLAGRRAATAGSWDAGRSRRASFRGCSRRMFRVSVWSAAEDVGHLVERHVGQVGDKGFGIFKGVFIGRGGEEGGPHVLEEVDGVVLVAEPLVQAAADDMADVPAVAATEFPGGVGTARRTRSMRPRKSSSGLAADAVPSGFGGDSAAMEPPRRGRSNPPAHFADDFEVKAKREGGKGI